MGRKAGNTDLEKISISISCSREGQLEVVLGLIAVRCLMGKWEPSRISWMWTLGFLGATGTRTKGECMFHIKGTAEGIPEEPHERKNGLSKPARSRKPGANSYQYQSSKNSPSLSLPVPLLASPKVPGRCRLQSQQAKVKTDGERGHQKGVCRFFTRDRL